MGGHYYAQYYLGKIYEFGYGNVRKSIMKAKSCYVASVLNGCQKAIPVLKRIGEKELQQKQLNLY